MAYNSSSARGGIALTLFENRTDSAMVLSLLLTFDPLRVVLFVNSKSSRQLHDARHHRDSRLEDSGTCFLCAGASR